MNKDQIELRNRLSALIEPALKTQDWFLIDQPDSNTFLIGSGSDRYELDLSHQLRYVVRRIDKVSGYRTSKQFTKPEVLAWRALLDSAASIKRQTIVKVHAKQPAKPNLKSLARFADFWGLGLRRAIKSMAGDFDEEIARLHRAKRYRMARWNKALAWMYAWWYVARGPFDACKKLFIGMFTGR